MFTSLRTKIVLLVLAILAATALPILYFTKSDVGTAMLAAEERSVNNVLDLVTLHIRGEYQHLLREKVEAVTERKARLAAEAAIVQKGLATFADLARRGLVPQAEAKDEALKWLAGQDMAGEEFFLYDRAGRLLFHPDAAFLGRDLSLLRDFKGRLVLPSMRGEAAAYGGGLAVFPWPGPDGAPRGKKLGHFVAVPGFDWMLAAVVDIGDIESQADAKLRQLVDALRLSLGQVHIAKTGFLFVFNAADALLAVPEGAVLPDKAALGDLLVRLKAAAATDDGLVLYTDAAGRVRELRAKRLKGLDWYVASQAPLNEIEAPATALVTRQSLIIAAIFILGLALALPLAGGIARPLNRLAGYAKELPTHDFAAAPAADSVVTTMAGRFRDEVGRLAEALAFMERELHGNIQRLMETRAAKERIEQELSIARDIQMGILPKIFPPFPDKGEADIYAIMEAAKEVGGDLYDFFYIDEHRLCFVVGDVAGKGVPAALFMAVTITLIKAVALRTPSPGSILEAVNKDLSRDNPSSMFVTLFCGLLDVRTGELLYANGGHNPPVLLRHGQAAQYLGGKKGAIVGAIPDLRFPVNTMTLEPGEALFLYSDGVTEAMNTEHALFGSQRLLEEVEKDRDAPIEVAVANVMAEVRAFAGEEPQSDDITVMLVLYQGPQAG
ncbi:MAG: SpoIIE family protein phosphatase [Solidesulfovibrio sp. DCME]|uniref:SpoIIE family protein phosphatase n=1 Tax=Solidesulfovibrio sp. DCME TaxID=3447380 RepID=UPI003D13EBA6